jgi:hypothetical protein
MMNQEETKNEIMSRFPSLFPNKPRCGFYCGAGWYPTIETMLSELDSYIQSNNIKNVVVDQIKEKFGVLRCYLNVYDENLQSIISKYENKTAHICESCGKNGEIRNIGWLKTRCDSCQEKWKLDNVQ